MESVVVGTANELPYKENCFKIVTCIDILECEAVIPKKTVGECIRVLEDGGIGIIVMAAHQCLLSEHDRAVHSVRRFKKRELTQLLHNHPVELLYAGYLFTLLFPFMALRKIMNPPRKKIQRAQAISDVRTPNPVINHILDTICRIESYLVPKFSLPLGTSVCVVYRKNA